MRNTNSLFILIVGLAGMSAFLAYEPRPIAAAREMLSQALTAVPLGAMNPLAPVMENLLPKSSNPPAVAVVPVKPGTPARIVRVPAIREASNYGWIQLPYGTWVDFVQERRNGLLIRYDESYVVIPRAAVEDGSVVLRKRSGDRAS